MLSGFNVKDRDSGVIWSKEQFCHSVDNCASAGGLLCLVFCVWTVIGTTSPSKGFSSGGAIKERKYIDDCNKGIQTLTKKFSRLLYK